MIFAGVDIGSLTAKAVILSESRVIAESILSTGHNSRLASRKALDEALDLAGIREEQIERIVATGYGRLSVDFPAEKVTEITCHAKGVHSLFPDVKTMIDMGGQDSKAIALGDDGRVIDFVMNEKCAAGTGRFLEVMARALEVALTEFGSLSLESKNPARISSVCTVFAESEVVSRIAEGASKVDIAAGIHSAVASRIYAMAMRIPVREPIVMTGGVAFNMGVQRALEERFGTEIIIPEKPQHTGALGAALIAESRAKSA
ncbi:MAG: acyl-CoA dehydratase activase [Actinomycetota bacterium]|nr:acyl-CoA dehydratase activase [Actinomycetota bacterium]